MSLEQKQQDPFPCDLEQFPPFQDPREPTATRNVFKGMGNVITLGTSRLKVVAYVFNLSLYFKELNETMMD